VVERRKAEKADERDPLHELVPFALSLLVMGIVMLATRRWSHAWLIIAPSVGMGVHSAVTDWWLRRRSAVYAVATGVLTGGLVALVTFLLSRYAVS
jgi:hypothetical protein